MDTGFRDRAKALMSAAVAMASTTSIEERDRESSPLRTSQTHTASDTRIEANAPIVPGSPSSSTNSSASADRPESPTTARMSPRSSEGGAGVGKYTPEWVGSVSFTVSTLSHLTARR
jgi:hypothetical protein